MSNTHTSSIKPELKPGSRKRQATPGSHKTLNLFLIDKSGKSVVDDKGKKFYVERRGFIAI